MISAENFITEIVIKKLNPTHIIVGKNFRFGNQRKGNIALLRKFGKIQIFKVSDLRLAQRKQNQDIFDQNQACYRKRQCGSCRSLTRKKLEY